MNGKKYVGCEKVLVVYPKWEICGRPVSVTKGPTPRCEQHPLKKIWPTEEVGVKC